MEPSRSTICALISPTFSLSRISCGSLPSRICWRISGTHFGHSESVVRGQPSGGLDFSHDLSSGLSDHFGVNAGAGLMRFIRSNTAHAPLAVRVTAFSTYLIGLCIAVRSPERRPATASPARRTLKTDRRHISLNTRMPALKTTKGSTHPQAGTDERG